MGTGTSARRNPVGGNNTVRQLATLHPLKPQPLEEPRQPPLTSSLPQTERQPRQPPLTSSQPQTERQLRKAKETEIIWPLPPDEEHEKFDIKWSTDKERYSVKRAYSLRVELSQKKFKPTKETEIINFHQKETSSSHWNKRNDSIHNSAHVQSSLYTQSHACVNLSTTDEINKLYEKIRQIQIDSDLTVEQKQKIISEVTKILIDIITGDTRTIQQNLLAFGQTIQMNHEKFYREWLQIYITQLDQWRSTQLANLQNEMEDRHKTIITQSQRLIMQANQEANTLKEDILKTAQRDASSKIQQTIEQIQNISVQHLGTETMTKINLIIHGNVGNKMPGQGCTFHFDQCDKHDQTKQHQRTEKPSTKKDLQRPKPLTTRLYQNIKKTTTQNEHEEQSILLGHYIERQDINHIEDYEDDDQD